jgi:ABC-type oligopeptide transport system ATPase subunit
VADRVIFMDRGEIVEQAPPDEFFAHPKSERTRAFLSQVIQSDLCLGRCAYRAYRFHANQIAAKASLSDGFPK